MNQKSQSSCIILSISHEAQRAAVLAGQPAAAVQCYPLAPGADIAEALRLGADVTADGAVVLRWAVRGDPAVRSMSGSDPLDRRPIDTADALIAIGKATLAFEQARILNRWPPQPLTPEDRAVLTAEQAAEVDAKVVERASQDAEEDAQRVAREVAYQAARDAAERAVAAFEAGGPDPDAAVYQWHTVQTGTYEVRVKAEQERRRIRRLAHLLGESGMADARFHEHQTDAQPLGLVSEEEARALVTDWVLPCATTPMTTENAKTPPKPPAYQLLQQGDVKHWHGCIYEDSVGFRSRLVDDLTRDEYLVADRTVMRLRAALPLVPSGHPLRASQTSWPALVRRHSGACDCGAEVSRLGIKVEVDLGDGVKIEREFGMLDK